MDLRPISAALAAVGADPAFKTMALIAQQFRQLRSLETASVSQLSLIKAARAQHALNCPQLAGYASAAAALAAQQQPLLQAIPGEVVTLGRQVGPAAIRVAAVQNQIKVAMAAQAQRPTDTVVNDQLNADFTAAGSLVQEITNAQSAPNTTPTQLAHIAKNSAAASSSTIEVRNLCTPHHKA